MKCEWAIEETVGEEGRGTYTVGQNTRESGRNATKEIEERVSLSNLI